MNATQPILAVSHLSVEFRQRHRPTLRAVDDISLDVGIGETLGLVGESGSGKSTIGRAILGLVSPTQGSIVFDGRDVTHASHRERRMLSAQIQVIFQDPFSSLNPSRRVSQTLAEPLIVHRELTRGEISARIRTALEQVGLAADAAELYPAQFSGGQRQRIAIARALMLSPRLVVCDEPTSALDLSVQAQILNLLSDLQRKLSLSYLFITHDLAVVRYLSHRIVVLKRGRVVESGAADRVYRHPAQPYTRALLEALPVPNPDVQRARRKVNVETRLRST
jgi:ABC-type oligopeptide transport system ATPase subunit